MKTIALSTILVAVLAAQLVTISVKATSPCCSKFTLSLRNLPLDVCSTPGNATFVASVLGGTPPYSYTISDNISTPAVATTSENPTQFVLANEPANFTLSVTVTDKNKCKATQSINVSNGCNRGLLTLHTFAIPVSSCNDSGYAGVSATGGTHPIHSV